MNRKTLILIVGAAVVVIAGGTTAFLLWGNNPPPPDPQTAQPEDVTNYLASDQFAKLPMEKKQSYTEKLRRNFEGRPRRGMMRSAENLSEEQREKLFENMRPVFMARMREEMNRYFDLPPEQRTAYLDEMIDRHEQMRQRWRNRPGSDGNERPRETGQNQNNQRRQGRGGRGRHFSPERFKRMIESTPPKDRAQFMEFRKAMRQRRKERGLPERCGPGRGR